MIALPLYKTIGPSYLRVLQYADWPSGSYSIDFGHSNYANFSNQLTIAYEKGVL
tara:strand:- start:26601 stop:26762 length:162 start_codon:yes stop_codon:yes gene_type:complete